MALIVTKVHPGNPMANADSMVAMVKEASLLSPPAYLFPELSLTGYKIDALFLQPVLHEEI